MLIKLLITLLLCNIIAYSSALVSENGNPDPEPGIIRMTLTRQKTAFEQHLNNAPFLKKYGINSDWLYKKHHKPSPRTNDSIAMFRYLDNEFYGTVVLGRTGKSLNVAFDTAWTMSWVLSSQCNHFKSMGCMFHNTYDHDKSKDYKADGRKIVVPEGTYNLSGFFSYDSVAVAHSNISNFSFVEMTNVPNSYLFNKIDGIIGFGLQHDAYQPFFYALVDQKKIAQPIFCIYLNRDKQSSHGGNIIMGFIEYRHVHSTKDAANNIVYDPITFKDIKPGYLWEFDLDAVHFDRQKGGPLIFCKGTGCTAFTDTSSNSILGPKADIDEIHKAINARSFFFDKYTVDCDTINKLPEIAFTIGGKNFTLAGRDYTIKMTYWGIGVCLSAFEPYESSNTWVLGGAFLSEYYTIYNIEDKQIGIVKAA
ncbi:aspartic proteinase A2 [Dendroctonus ponderosae]